MIARVPLAIVASLTVAAASIAVSGCDRAPPEIATEPAPAVGLRILDWGATESLVRSHRGKVVVVDLWSTICTPCLRELPSLVALDRRYGADQLVCITVSCDFAGLANETPESLRGAVLEVLEKLGATCENILLSVPAEELFDHIGLASIPAVWVWAKDGNLVRRFDYDGGLYGDEGFTYAKHITPLVENLIAGK